MASFMNVNIQGGISYTQDGISLSGTFTHSVHMWAHMVENKSNIREKNQGTRLNFSSTSRRVEEQLLIHKAHVPVLSNLGITEQGNPAKNT